MHSPHDGRVCLLGLIVQMTGSVLVPNVVRVVGVAVVLFLTGLVAGAGVAAAAAPGADVRAVVEAGFQGSTDEEYRAWAEVLAAASDSPAMSRAAADALAGTDAQLRAFVDGGYLAAWHADERVRLARVLDAATGPAVTAGAQAALASNDPQVWSDFLTTGLAAAQYADDRLMAATMLTGGVNNSGPALDAAAQAALAGTPAELREFLLTGQFAARAHRCRCRTGCWTRVAGGAPAAAPQPTPVTVAPSGGRRSSSAQVLAATGPFAEGPMALLAATAVLGGASLVVVARRRQRA